MVDQQLLERVTQLPVDARLELIEVLTRSLRSDFHATSSKLTEVVVEESLPPATNHQPSTEERAAALHRLFGALSNDAHPPTDEEWKDEYIAYLTRKYE